MTPFEITKALLALIVVLATTVLGYMVFAGSITPTPEGAAISGYLLAEARVILADYFKRP